jgi:hypothetical protein
VNVACSISDSQSAGFKPLIWRLWKQTPYPRALLWNRCFHPYVGLLTCSYWDEGLEPSCRLQEVGIFAKDVFLLFVFKQFPTLCSNQACSRIFGYTRSSHNVSFTHGRLQASCYAPFNWICQCGVNPVSAPGPVTIWSGNDIWRIMSVPRSAGTRVLLTGNSLTVGSRTYTTGSWCADQHLITEISKSSLVKQPCKSLGKSITILPDSSLSYGTGKADSTRRVCVYVKSKTVKFTPEQAMKGHRESSDIVLLFL